MFSSNIKLYSLSPTRERVMTNVPPLWRKFRFFFFRNRDISKGRPWLGSYLWDYFYINYFVDFNESINYTERTGVWTFGDRVEDHLFFWVSIKTRTTTFVLCLHFHHHSPFQAFQWWSLWRPEWILHINIFFSLPQAPHWTLIFILSF